MATEKGDFNGPHRRKNDTTFPVEVRAKIVESGKPYMLSIVRDITDRKPPRRSTECRNNCANRPCAIR